VHELPLVIAANKDAETGEMVDRYLSDEDLAGHRRDLPGSDRAGPPRGRPGGALGCGPARRRPHPRVATLARQDGRGVFPRNDFYRSGEASRAVEATAG
jgi:hypothetical protein